MSVSDYQHFLRPQWFQMIIANRPHYGEDVAALVGINDIRNGLFANNFIHPCFDLCKVFILKVRHIY